MLLHLLACAPAPEPSAPPPPATASPAARTPPAPAPAPAWTDGAPTGEEAVEQRGATTLRILAHQPDPSAPAYRLRLEHAGAAVELVATRPWSLSGGGAWLLLDGVCPDTATTPDPMCLAAQGGDATKCPVPPTPPGVRVWDVAGAKCWNVGEFPGDVSGIAWSPDDAHVAWTEDDVGAVRVVVATPGTRTVHATAAGVHEACGGVCVAKPVRWADGTLEVPAAEGVERYDARLARL